MKPNDDPKQVLQDVGGTLGGNAVNVNYQNSRNSMGKSHPPIDQLMVPENVLEGEDSTGCTVSLGPQMYNNCK